MSREPVSPLESRLAEARRLATQGQFASARRRALSTLSRGAEPPADERAAVAVVLAEIARRAVAGGAPQEAEQCLRMALRQRPEFADLHHRLASLLESLQRYDEARRGLVQALPIHPAYLPPPAT